VIAPGVALGYRRQATPLHAARASASGAYCLALAVAAVLVEHPLILVAVAVAVAGAGLRARSGSALRRGLRLALWFVLLAALLNPLLDHNGLTVIARLGHLGPFGALDVTLEAVVHGLVFGLRATVVILALSLASAAVDPDEVLTLLRRVSFRSALTASLATRMVPLLASDARRLSAALRCRPEQVAREWRRRKLAHDVAIVRAVTSTALDRALDVAAALELKGYALAGRCSGPGRRWSRHDLAHLAAAVSVLAVVILGRLGGIAHFSTYPRLEAAWGPGEVALALGVVLMAWTPLLGRRGLTR
jgi:energy-coupling factor transport system permease protein